MSEREAASIDAQIAAVSASARALLWVITRAREPLTERLIERLWSGESLNLEFLRRIQGELSGLPPALRAQIEAQLPAEVLAQVKALGSGPGPSAPPPLAPLLAELLTGGLLGREGEGEDAPLGAAPPVAASITAWMAQRPDERGGRTEEQVWRTLGERYVGAFEALAGAAAEDASAQELAVETGRRGIRYLVRAGAEELEPIAGRMLGAAADPALRARLVAEVASAAEEAPAGAQRRSTRAALAAGIAEAAGNDTAVLERALSLYEYAIDEAEQAADEAGYREAAALGQRWAEALDRAGQQPAARDAFRRSAANARRAGLPRAEVIALELEASRLGMRHGGDVEAVEKALARHLEELGRLSADARRGEGAAAVPGGERVGQVHQRALDIAVQLDLALDRWQPALDRLDQAEALLQQRGEGEHALAVNRCQRYLPLARLGRLDEAERALEESLAVFVETEDGPHEVGTRSRLADLWDERGDAAKAVLAAEAALRASERLEEAEMRASCHENLATYLEKAGDAGRAREHQLADLVYRVVARLDVSRALRALNLDVLRAAARGERHALPRLAELLARGEFAALKSFLDERGVPEGPLQAGIDQLLEAVQAGMKPGATRA